MSPSTSSSSTLSTSTRWAVFQFAGVKVRLVGDTLPSVLSLLLRPIVTSPLGRLFSTTLNWSTPGVPVGPNPSVVTRPLIGVTVMPALSSSRLVTWRLDRLMPL